MRDRSLKSPSPFPPPVNILWNISTMQVNHDIYKYIYTFFTYVPCIISQIDSNSSNELSIVVQRQLFFQIIYNHRR